MLHISGVFCLTPTIFPTPTHKLRDGLSTMTDSLTLASSSEIRAALLRNAGVSVNIAPVKVDEDAMKSALINEGAEHRDIADSLAELKARRGGSKNPNGLTLGADQVLSFNGDLLSKPDSPATLIDQLQALNGQVHMLYSAAVIYEGAEPQWRAIGQAQMIMRPLTSEFIAGYVKENWDEVRYCVGGYQVEAAGAQLFSRIQGDYFSVLGLPLLEILGYLRTRGLLAS